MNMIPKQIHRLFDFVDYLDQNKAEYKKFIPLCDELIKLDGQRNSLNPNANYKDKLSHDRIQNQIEEKFIVITENIYNPITNKLLELNIWSGDVACASIWNNSISAIYEFREKFIEEDVITVMQYKQKYLDFRTETNTNFLSLQVFIKSLDDILKELFSFYKDTDENEFENFEARKIKVNSLKEALEIALENGGENISFSLPSETILPNLREAPIKTYEPISINHNKIIMGDNTEIGNISHNSGQISVGKEIRTEVNGKDELTKKAYNWQKWGIIIATIISVIGIIIAVVFS